MNRPSVILALQIGVAAIVCADDKGIAILDHRLDASTNAPAPIVYWHESRKEPRPLQIHVLRVDLHAKAYEVVTLIVDDPDGDGGAEAELEKPLPFASQHGVVAAVNANAFDLFPPPKQSEKRVWKEHAPVDILGWAENPSRRASPPQKGVMSVWIGADGRGHVGNLGAPEKARAAAAGFGAVVTDGEIAEYAREPFHPRSAVGFDRDGWTMWLVVVDGRQNGYSEGMALVELGTLMKELGCWNAINLDGGGSSIMLLAADGKTLQIMNRPSDAGTRPIPVMLAVRPR